MASQTVLTLGDFVFQDLEVPESIGFGLEQRLAVKKLVGGVRDIQALGPDPRPIDWSGIFLPTPEGESALDRAEAIKSMVIQAQPVTLSWDRIYLMVYIRSFDPDYRFARIPYRISCEVIQDLTTPDDLSAEPDADDLIDGDMNSINNAVPGIGDSTLSSLTATLSSAVSSVKTFVGAGISTISSVLQPLNAARSQVLSLIGATDSVLNSVATVGGILPGVPIAQNIFKLESQVNGVARMTGLLQLNGYMGRMSINLGQINSSVRTITVGGGNLYDLAAKEYGNAMGWVNIAKANNLTDPTITGISTLVIPPFSNDSSGLLTA
jgi:nucleoid-associated protein YgaU